MQTSSATIPPIENAETPTQIGFNEKIVPILQQLRDACAELEIPYFLSMGLGQCPTCPPDSSQWIESSRMPGKDGEPPANDLEFDGTMRIAAFRQLTKEGRVAANLAQKHMMLHSGGGIGALLEAPLSGGAPAPAGLFGGRPSRGEG